MSCNSQIKSCLAFYFELMRLRRNIDEIYKKEELKRRQKAHIKWLKERDVNNAFFYRSVSRRHISNKMHALRLGTEIVS